MVAQINRPASLPTPIPLAQGMVQLFIAPRSQYADVLASAMRTAGQGSPVLVVQMAQGGQQSMVKLCQHLTWWRCPSDRYLDQPDVVLREAEIDGITALWQMVKRAVSMGDYRLVVVEGLDLAVQYGLVSEAEVLQVLSQRSLNVDIVLMGQSLPASMLEIADQITKCRS